MTKVMTHPLRYNDEHLETMPADQIADLQWSKLGPLLRDVWAQNAFFRAHWQAVGVDIDKIDSLAAFREGIPTVDKAAFMADQQVEKGKLS